MKRGRLWTSRNKCFRKTISRIW